VIERFAVVRVCRGSLDAGAGVSDFDLNDPAASPLARSVAAMLMLVNCTVIWMPELTS
jgi:hypothetical protein